MFGWLKTLWSVGTSIPSLLAGPYGILIRLAVIGGFLGGFWLWGYGKGRAHEENRLNAIVAKVQAEGDKALAHQAEIRLKQREVSDATVKGLQGDLQALNDRYDSAVADLGRVRSQSDTRGRALRELANSSIGSCAGQADELSGRLDAVEREVLDLLRQADDERIRYNKLWDDWNAQSKIR